MLEWILIILVLAAIFGASSLPKLKLILETRTKEMVEKAKAKKLELEEKIKQNKNKKNDAE